MYNLDFGDIIDIDHELAEITDIETRFRHTYILGTTGSGKSVLMERMAMYDINYGCACIFIDPKGNHAKRIYSSVKDKDRIIYLSSDHPSVVINPLRRAGYELDSLVDEFIDVLDIYVKLRSPANPPATENMTDVFWEVFSALDEKDREIDFLIEFLRYQNVRYKYLTKRGRRTEYWIEFDKKEGGRKSSEALTAKTVAIRLSKFLRNKKFLKLIKGRDTLDIEDIAKNKKVLLVDTSDMTMDRRILFTAMLSCAVKSYCEFNTNKKYHPLMFYMDECWMGINDSFEYLLSDARDYQVGFTLANQHINQFPNYNNLNNKLVSMMGALCNTKVSFFLPGADESKMMSRVYGLKAEEFINLEDYDAWVRIKNKNSLVTAHPPIIVNEIFQPPAPTASGEFNFLKDSWISI